MDRDHALHLLSTSEEGNSRAERRYMKGGGCRLTGLDQMLAKWSIWVRAQGLSGTLGAIRPNAQQFPTLAQNSGPERELL